ncbi:immunoglobulin iota chain-like [Nycticebus coucang]|uniref:immunoglobulin iota chain-like n=1 Tax=Nycticebus coucang TaxID=9470 RepID=UPI00234C5344|nr:immunoglobulin iota chain-like [Nycticebus coucang]
MAWTPLLLFSLLLYCTESLCQLMLTQPPSTSASLGASVKLTCTLDSGHSNYGIGWQQQQPGKAPRYIMRLSNDGASSKGDGIPDRFSGSSSGADRYLTISNLQSEDKADYYCQTSDWGMDWTPGSVPPRIPGPSFPTGDQELDDGRNNCLLDRQGCLSQPVLTQLPSASASLGTSVKLTCTLSSVHRGYSIHWYQQQPGKTPQYLMWIGSTGSFTNGDGIPDRFSGSGLWADG